MEAINAIEGIHLTSEERADLTPYIKGDVDGESMIEHLKQKFIKEL